MSSKIVFRRRITFFDHNFGYGVKLRIKVRSEKLKEYGGLKDQLISLIAQKAKEEDIDLTTPVLETQIPEKGGEKGK